MADKKEPKEAGVMVEVEGGSRGISIETAKGELQPPLTEERMEEERVAEEEQVLPKKVVQKLPLSPSVVKPPLRFEGLVLAEVTGYPGWMYTEEELQDFCDLIAQCGIELDPRLQVLLGLTTLHAAKFVGYTMWKKTGKKGSLKEKETGEVAKIEVKGEETRL